MLSFNLFLTRLVRVKICSSQDRFFLKPFCSSTIKSINSQYLPILVFNIPDIRIFQNFIRNSVSFACFVVFQFCNSFVTVLNKQSINQSVSVYFVDYIFVFVICSSTDPTLVKCHPACLASHLVEVTIEFWIAFR